MAEAQAQSTPTQNTPSLPAGQVGNSAPVTAPQAAAPAAPAPAATQEAPATDGGVLASIATPDPAATQGQQPPVEDGNWELTVPEGMPEGFFDAEAVKAFHAHAKEAGFTKKQADGLLGFEAARVKALGEKQAKAFDQQQSDWAQDLKKEFGQKYDAKLAAAKQAFAKFGPQGADGERFRADMAAFGIGNYPALVKWAAAVGEAMANDSSGGGGGSGGQLTEGQRIHQMYPNSTNPDGSVKKGP